MCQDRISETYANCFWNSTTQSFATTTQFLFFHALFKNYVCIQKQNVFLSDFLHSHCHVVVIVSSIINTLSAIDTEKIIINFSIAPFWTVPVWCSLAEQNFTRSLQPSFILIHINIFTSIFISPCTLMQFYDKIHVIPWHLASAICQDVFIITNTCGSSMSVIHPKLNSLDFKTQFLVYICFSQLCYLISVLHEAQISKKNLIDFKTASSLHMKEKHFLKKLKTKYFMIGCIFVSIKSLNKIFWRYGCMYQQRYGSLHHYRQHVGNALQTTCKIALLSKEFSKKSRSLNA